MSIGAICKGFGQIRNLGSKKKDYLFKKGDTSHTFSVWSTNVKPSCYIYDSLLVMSQTSISTASYSGFVGKYVDLSKYHKLIFEIERAEWRTNSYVWLSVCKSNLAYIWEQGGVAKKVSLYSYSDSGAYPNYPNKYKVVIDVSDLSGSYYVGACIQSGGGSYGNIRFKNIYLEK